MADEINDQVRAEMHRFRDALPRLLEEHRGKWVVFLDGVVRGVYADEDQAYAAGLETFGLDRVFVVAEVIEDTGPHPVTEGIFFGGFTTSTS
jgi:hypothetical protein